MTESVFSSRTFVRDRRTWIATLVVGSAIVAGTSAWLNRRVPIVPRKAAAPEAEGRLVVLAFDRIVAVPDGGHVDRVALKDALRAMSHAGWQAVSLAEVKAAYAAGVKLPAKPCLLTFDEGYLSTYESVDPVLRELRWPAVMFLRTERQERQDVSFLYWDRLSRMVQSGLWTVASGDPPDASTSCASGVPGTPPGEPVIAEKLGAQGAAAWAPRGLDPMVTLGCADAPRGGTPWLGFVDDVAGAGSPDGNPLRVPRLRVAPSWTASDLLARMERAVASPPPAPPAGPPAPLGDRWVEGEGTAAEDGGWIRLRGAPRAEIWIPAARWANDWQLEARVDLGGGEFWIVQPDEARRREWRMGAVDGRLYVESRIPGQPPEVLARADRAGVGRGRHTFALVKRGRGVQASWDGRPLTKLPIALPSVWRGKIGVVAYAPSGEAALSLSDVRFSAYPYRVRDVASSPDAGEVQAMAREAGSIAAISPPWAVADGGAVREGPIDRDLMRMLSRRYAWDLMPRVAARGGVPGDPEAWAKHLAERAVTERFDGLALHIEAEPVDAVPPAWMPAVDAVDRALRGSNLRLLVTVTR
jgi:hypothetical protein